jgi:hypothetical protein
MCVAAVPPWFTNEVAHRLSGVTHPNPASAQHYAHCPVPRHADRHHSFAIKPGDSIQLVYQCHVDCANEEIRAALASLGVPEEYLGPLGTPPFEARRRAQASSADRRRVEELEKQVERLRWEMLELQASIRGLMNSDLKLALLKIRILAVMEDVDIPVEEEPYVAFAARAGVPKSTAYRVWKTDPLVQVQIKCVVSGDHVVLTHSGDGSQVALASGAAAILKPITGFSNQERPGSQSENGSTSKHSRNENAPTKPAA